MDGRDSFSSVNRNLLTGRHRKGMHHCGSKNVKLQIDTVFLRVSLLFLQPIILKMYAKYVNKEPFKKNFF
jgi:hypothetical protein